MPAYNSNFLTPIGTQIVGAIATVTPPCIPVKELLVAGGEIIMAGEEFDIVEQQVDCIAITVDIELIPLGSIL